MKRSGRTVFPSDRQSHGFLPFLPEGPSGVTEGTCREGEFPVSMSHFLYLSLSLQELALSTVVSLTRYAVHSRPK